ncbi:hypothetical protein ANN_21548 [Periplaneta americana]|uniref:Uncharacterized protein n=1 Tax=Periplaneta americana TaxID=6978 RepID=A0ABQ8S697_PERAM|nr:hypothetical protein ANN_21548 [Periplaneta americana]
MEAGRALVRSDLDPPVRARTCQQPRHTNADFATRSGPRAADIRTSALRARGNDKTAENSAQRQPRDCSTLGQM